MPQQAPVAVPPVPAPLAVAPAQRLPAAEAMALPAAAKESRWKVWAGLTGIAVLAGAGAVLWLRPDLLGLGSSTARPRGLTGGGDGPRLVVPPALKAVKEKADAGDAGSMRYLGTCYANGLGVPRDLDEAKRWFRRAAEAGSQAAREELANLQRQER
jgi:TPR repeat protein